MIDLNTAIDPALGWHLQNAVAINAAGQIAGQGYNATGQLRGYLLTPK